MPIPERVQYSLPALLGGRMRFVASDLHAITLDKGSVSGRRASLRLQAGCGPMCVRGEQVSLTRTAGVWQLDASRAEWIS